MSRRVVNDRAAQNQQTIKSLLKLEYNKTCADCKRNKHPRWASWNLGIFICIRCSGIHRGMGTHISRVKSVDLDSWTDEQLASVIKWGNARANKYWEGKLAPGHVPSEAKIENFIRTKYESRRWVMDGPMPDPSTLDNGDDDVPLAIVQEKAKLERSASARVATTSQPPLRRPAQNIDLFGDDDAPAPPARPSTVDPPPSRPPPPNTQAAPKQKPADSLLGLDFFGSSQPTTGSRPSSVVSTPAGTTGPSRPDLKQSILSLYAKPQSPPVQHSRNDSFGGLSSPASQQSQQSQSSAFAGLTDAFSGLTFPSTSTPVQKQPAKSSAFSDFGSFSSSKPSAAAPSVTSPSSSSGLDFFNSAPAKSAPRASQPTSPPSNGLDFSFASMTAPAKPKTSPPAPAPAPSISNDLFDLAAPPTKSTSPPISSPPPASNLNSVFNLSSASQPAVKSPPTTSTVNAGSMFSSNMDPWGSDAWSTPEAPKPQPSSMMKAPSTITANDIGGGWGASSTPAAATVTADEDFGGWTSAAPSTTTSAPSTKPTGGFAANEDLFSNVWE